ncbi:hypothetical protein RS030_101626 [Cryptosporidium xiaoi]|uniref:Uncharacterized protein n=1 Tax=Cryptosporidium xiaoi TaxID=659607 RepID=A0AAV9Y2E2_9CRYT
MEKTNINVITCCHCNTKNEYIDSIFVKCYFCTTINFVGYPSIGKIVQCIKVLCPRCVSYTTVPKDCTTCRCIRCGLFMIVDSIVSLKREESKTESESSSEVIQC